MSVGEVEVLRVEDHEAELRALLAAYGLQLVLCDGAVPGSYWGEPEAGLLADRVYARPDTPVHSVLHEIGHVICMDGGRRAALATDAGGDELEEAAVCYLQILLADRLPAVGRERLCGDMDRWGYSFRLGSARIWFEQDAEDARQWLLRHHLIDADGGPTFRLRD